MVQIWYSDACDTLSPDLFDTYLPDLPLPIQHRICRFTNRKSANACLLGHVLLAEALAHLRLMFTLGDLQYTEDRRPFLPANVDFNISHAGAYVLCAISEQHRLGIDIEFVKPVDLAPRNWCFTPQEWRSITEGADPQRQFYRLWTQKEAAGKADGRGLSVALPDISIQPDGVKLAGRHWYIQEVQLAPEYMVHVATDQPIAPCVLYQYACKPSI